MDASTEDAKTIIHPLPPTLSGNENSGDPCISKHVILREYAREKTNNYHSLQKQLSNLLAEPHQGPSKKTKL